MARRTPTDATATETPTLHGHYDGPRGLEDEHRHLGGDKPHAHKGDSHLGRTAPAIEYVHGDQLPQARRELAEQRRVQALADAPTDQVPWVVGGVDAPVPTHVAELVKASAAGNGSRPQKYADLIKIAEKVEALRSDVQGTVDLETELDAASDLLAAARAQEANGEVVDPAILYQLEECHDRYAIRLQNWLLQRGVLKAEGAGS
jgi:hypothetical protein